MPNIDDDCTRVAKKGEFKTERKLSNPPRYCNGCNIRLMEDEYFKDLEDFEYCEDCKNKVEIVGEEFDYEE